MEKTFIQSIFILIFSFIFNEPLQNNNVKIGMLNYNYSFVFNNETLNHNIKSDCIMVNYNYKPYHAFSHITKNKKYKCYGVPCEKYREKYCKKCGKTYVLQRFCLNGETTTVFYFSYSECGRSKYHDNMNITKADPCVCDDDIGTAPEYD